MLYVEELSPYSHTDLAALRLDKGLLRFLSPC